MPKRVQSMLTRSPRDFDIITPGTSIVAKFKTKISIWLQDFDMS